MANKILSKCLIGILLVTCFFGTQHSTYASTPSTYSATVTATTLNVRSTPSTSGSIIGSFKYNQRINVLAEQNGWGKVMVGQKSGWIAVRYVKKVTSPTTNAYVNATTLNVRSTPSTSSAVVATLKKGQAITVLKTSGAWLQIKTPSGKTGWVAKQYTSTQPTSKLTLTANANLRQGPGTNYPIVKQGKKNDTYPIVTKQNDWVKIQLSASKAAWVASWLTSLSADLSVLKGKVLVLDPGHGGKDSGTIGADGTYEKTVALRTAKLVESRLENAGAKVVMTRDGDTYPTLSDRVAISHKYHADAFISMHYNSAGKSASGIESYYYTESKDKNLATYIQKGLVKYTGMKDLGVAKGDFHVIRENQDPATLLELGFLSNPNEEDKILTNSFQQNAAKGIVEGITNYFNSIK